MTKLEFSIPASWVVFLTRPVLKYLHKDFKNRHVLDVSAENKLIIWGLKYGKAFKIFFIYLNVSLFPEKNVF